MKLIEIKCGEKMGCVFDDEIIISISPSIVERLKTEYRKKAVETNNYLAPGDFRELSDFFDECYGEWEDKREKLSE